MTAYVLITGAVNARPIMRDRLCIIELIEPNAEIIWRVEAEEDSDEGVELSRLARGQIFSAMGELIISARIEGGKPSVSRRLRATRVMTIEPDDTETPF